MALTATSASETLQIKRTFSATPEQVFAAWSNPEALGKWFGPQSHTCRVDNYEFKVGGKYQLSLIPGAEGSDCGDGENASVCAGEFVQVDAPNLIVMSFSWIENADDIGDTLLTIEIKAHADGSELILTHERLPDEDLRLAHMAGWESTLDGLQDFLS